MDGLRVALRFSSSALARVHIVVWLGIWWAGVVVTGVSPDFLPSPWQVGQKLVWLAQGEHRIGEGTLWVHAGWSMLRFLSGFLVALALGLPLGLLTGQFRLAGDLLAPPFNALRNIPPIAWAPFSLLWFGASFGSQTFVIFTAAAARRPRAGARPARALPVAADAPGTAVRR